MATVGAAKLKAAGKKSTTNETKGATPVTDTTSTPNTTAKATRMRAFVRQYDYNNLAATVKDSNGVSVLDFALSDLPEAVLRKLALSAAMGIIAGAGVEAVRDKEDGKAAMSAALEELKADSFEFRDGVGVAMGGTLRKVARALTELKKADGSPFTYVKGPDGKDHSWTAGDVNGAFAAMKALWDTPEVTVPDGVIESGPNKGKPKTKVTQVSGRTQFNKVKAMPAVAALVSQYSKTKDAPELG